MRLRLNQTTALLLSLCILGGFALTALALDGVYHNPAGADDLYGGKEVGTDPCERYPRDPGAGETVYIKSKTWPVESGQSVWVTWTKNGVAQPSVGAAWKYNSGNDTHWEASLGSFAKGDVITYTVHADHYGGNQKTTGPYSFVVTDWDWVQNVTGVTAYSDRVELTCSSNSGTLNPKISFSFPGNGYFRLQFEPLGAGSFSGGLTGFTVDTSNPSHVWINGPDVRLKVIKAPYQLEIYDGAGNFIAKEYDRYGGRSLAFKTNGTNYVGFIEENFYTPSDESFTGFGMRYDALNQKGRNVDIYTVNWYLEQENKTYLPIPFYFTNKGYGTYLNSTYYIQYRLGTDVSDKATVRATAGGYVNTGMDLYFFTGTPKEISQKYTDIIQKPALPEVWTLGPWISANEWNSQAKIEAEMAAISYYDIPTTGLVIEAWADEETFYIWGDAQYTPAGGDWKPKLSDFTFGGRWPNPKGMVDDLHDMGIRVLLWQLPLIKSAHNPIPQLAADEAYAISQGYVLTDGYGNPYRNKGGWYGGAVSPDFTNPQAVDWLLGKREYLLAEIGIDGFKTDGGEFIWGRDITASNGMKGDELRNLYPDLYSQAYYEFSKRFNPLASVFCRSGGAGAAQHPVAWTGDQNSSFSAYRDAIRATMTASMSGVPFVTWDLAGFSGEIPGTELYKRSVAQAAFSPVMQLHSEWGGDPTPSVARTPWNMYERTGDIDCVNIYRKFTNIRMSMIPYLFNEAKYTNATGVPMMRSMSYEFPYDATAAQMEFQYMMGENLLVAPIENEGQTSKTIYLPQGEWIDLFWGAKRPGTSFITYNAGLDAIPVFIKAGSVLPLNLNADYDFGGSVGNSVSEYQNLTFRIYPQGNTVYDYYDYVNEVQRQISIAEDYVSSQVSVSVPAMPQITSLQVFTGRPGQVMINGASSTQYTGFSTFKTAASGWYYDAAQHLTFVRVPASASATSVVLTGVREVPYEAEFAVRIGTTVNNNHAGYEGTGFVDGFDQVGRAVQFDVFAPAAGVYTLDIRYSAGVENAARNLYVNSIMLMTVSLDKTADWDTWDSKSVTVSLNEGANTIIIAYDGGNKAGINLDSIRLRR